MKKIVILGAGTAGTMVANRLEKMLDLTQWSLTMVDEDPIHYYQAGYIFVPFGMEKPKNIVKPKKKFISSNIKYIETRIKQIEPETQKVILENGSVLDYDYLIVATGCDIYPEETPGMAEHEWGKSIHSFYTLDTAVALEQKLRSFDGGRLVVNVVENPIKCPVAPMEFIMLADYWFTKRGMRDKVELIYATPLPGAFTKPIASKMIGDLLDSKNIKVESEFYIESVDPDAKKIVSYDEREVAYDLLVSVPVNKGADIVGEAGLGDELNFAYVNKHTFLSDKYDNIFVLGDAANVPTSKAGSVAHYAIDHFGHNFKRYINGQVMLPEFDGHANCFVESGYGKGVLIDFNYEQEPLPGTFPVPGIGPFQLLKNTRINHLGKLSFMWMYWNILMRGLHVPLPANMMMAGKKQVSV